MNDVKIRVPKAYTLKEIEEEIKELKSKLGACTELWADQIKVSGPNMDNHFRDLYNTLSLMQVLTEDYEAFVKAKKQLEE